MTSEARAQAKTCIHHWVIDAPTGRESRGTCKHCGTAKNFANSNEHVMWEQTNTLRNTLRVARPADSHLADEFEED